MALRRIMRELSDLKSKPPEGVAFWTHSSDLFQWQILFNGPAVHHRAPNLIDAPYFVELCLFLGEATDVLSVYAGDAV